MMVSGNGILVVSLLSRNSLLSFMAAAAAVAVSLHFLWDKRASLEKFLLRERERGEMDVASHGIKRDTEAEESSEYFSQTNNQRHNSSHQPQEKFLLSLIVQ
jgi:hypothetical protein